MVPFAIDVTSGSDVAGTVSRITFLIDIILLRKVKLEQPVIAQLKRALWELDGRYMSDLLLAGFCSFGKGYFVRFIFWMFQS